MHIILKGVFNQIYNTPIMLFHPEACTVVGTSNRCYIFRNVCVYELLLLLLLQDE